MQQCRCCRVWPRATAAASGGASLRRPDARWRNASRSRRRHPWEVLASTMVSYRDRVNHTMRGMRPALERVWSEVGWRRSRRVRHFLTSPVGVRSGWVQYRSSPSTPVPAARRRVVPARAPRTQLLVRQRAAARPHQSTRLARSGGTRRRRRGGRRRRLARAGESLPSHVGLFGGAAPKTASRDSRSPRTTAAVARRRTRATGAACGVHLPPEACDAARQPRGRSAPISSCARCTRTRRRPTPPTTASTG